MIRLLPISPPRPADDFARIPLLDLRQLPRSVPLEEYPKQLKEPA